MKLHHQSNEAGALGWRDVFGTRLRLEGAGQGYDVFPGCERGPIGHEAGQLSLEP